MRTVKDTMTIKELFWALQTLRSSSALNKECEQAVQVCHLLLANFISVVNITYPYEEVIKWSHDVSELNECAMDLRREVGLRRENARLIAAAPEMLEALKLLAEEVDDLSANNLDAHNWTHHQNLLTLANTAITKATGIKQ
jgi:hypothetical protein